MPRTRKVVRTRTVTRTRTRTRGRKRGGSKFLDFFKKINAKLRSSKLLSKLGTAYASTALPYSGAVGKASGVAAKLGYGRRCRPVREHMRCRKRGGALRLAGGRMGYRGRV